RDSAAANRLRSSVVMTFISWVP
ncbi:MAG: hypothetical protein JWR46_3531, partial [Mycobacterium sp.]|nr:hypothetical protein [Mycobacterium sp.]